MNFRRLPLIPTILVVAAVATMIGLGVWQIARAGQKRDLCNVITQYTHTGSQVYLEGRLVYETWEDKNGGGKRSKHKLVVDEVQLLDKVGDSGGGGGDDEMGAPRSNFSGGSRGVAPARGPAPRPSTPPPDDDFGGDEKQEGEIPF